MARDYRGGDGRKGPGRTRKRTGKGRGAGAARGKGTGAPTPAAPSLTDGDTVVVNGYSAQWLRRGFPWVYADEVQSRPRALALGDTVQLAATDGKALGAGIWCGGHVAVRRFRATAGPVDAALLLQAVQAAAGRRVLPPETTAWRLLHGENDDTPGLRVEVWDRHVSVSLDSPALGVLVAPLLDAVAQVHPHDTAWVHCRPLAEQDAGRGIEAHPVALGCVRGGPQDPELEVEVLERGVRFGVMPGAGPDAGLFVDMRDVRAWLEPHWQGRELLNLFAHTGAFSVSAAVHGARRAVSVDLSGPALERAEANLRRNGLDPAQHPVVQSDVFKALDRFRRTGDAFDVVIADPPSFSHAREGRWSAVQDYPRLVAAALRVLRPGGWLVAATNQGKVSPKDFLGQLQKGASKAGRRLRLIHEGDTPMDVPAALDFPESRYLKCWVMVADLDGAAG